MPPRPVLPLSRRALLGGSAALAAATLAPRPARAAVAPDDLKFVFVVVFRGWDVTRVYAPEFDNAAVSMEADAERMTIGGLELVDHPYRPSVRDFFEAWHARSVVLNGLVVPSLSHVECLRLAMTGSNAVTEADWPARIAAAAQDRYALPHVVVNGPNFPGNLGGSVTRIGSTAWVEQVLDGSILERADGAPRRFSDAGSAAMDAATTAFSTARVARARSTRELALANAYASSNSRLATLKARAGELTWPGDTTLPSQSALAVDLLRLDLSRCVTVAHDFADWDSHADNDARQSDMFESLYAGLGDLMDRLSAAPGTRAETLADETVVVVLSEMGRTPNMNGGAGKDHWPHTSTLLIGPNLDGSRVVGGYSELFTGQNVDLASGDVTDTGTQVSTKVLGATLLGLAGIDPAESLGVAPISGMLT